MKKLSAALIALASIVAFPTISLAGCSETDCQGVTIDTFYAQSNLLLIGTSDDETKLNCRSVSDRYLALPTERRNYAFISGFLLTAYESQHPICISVREINGRCTIYSVESSTTGVDECFTSIFRR